MKKSKVKTGNYLELIPVHHSQIDSTMDEHGNVIILQEHKGLFYWITQKLLKKPRVSQIHLDEMGNFIWPLMDGTKDILAISELVKAEFGEKAEPLYNRLVTYMDTMERYGFVELKKKSEESQTPNNE